MEATTIIQLQLYDLKYDIVGDKIKCVIVCLSFSLTSIFVTDIN